MKINDFPYVPTAMRHFSILIVIMENRENHSQFKFTFLNTVVP